MISRDPGTLTVRRHRKHILKDTADLLYVAHGFLHRQDQLMLIIGLQNIVQGPQDNGLLGVGEIIVVADKQKGAGASVFADPAGYLQAAGAGHFDV